jgi:flotillin
VIKEAEANANARKAKADRDAEAKLIEADARQRAEQARLTADTAVAVAETALRIRKAELAREAALKEAAQQEAEAKAEQNRLAATEVAKALADRDVAKARAQGDAAQTLEEGKARAAAIEQIGQAIAQHPEALRVMLVEMTPRIIAELASTVKDVDLSNVTVIDSGGGGALAGAALGRARVLTETLAMLDSVLGIDLRTVSQEIARNVGGAAAARPLAGDGKSSEPKPAASAQA